MRRLAPVSRHLWWQSAAVTRFRNTPAPPRQRHAASRSLSTALPALQPSVPENVGVADDRGLRKWYYVIDSHGQLFLHDTVPKNFTTCYKDKKFLDFFFKRLAPNTTPYHRNDYDWLSPCGRELNYIFAEDTPIVFQDLTDDGNLVWGGTMTYPFDPSAISVDASTGHVYHPAPVRLPLPSSIPLLNENEAVNVLCSAQAPEVEDPTKVLRVALLRSSLVLDRLDLTSDGSSIIWDGKRYPIRVENIRVR